MSSRYSISRRSHPAITRSYSTGINRMGFCKGSGLQNQVYRPKRLENTHAQCIEHDIVELLEHT